VVMIELAHYTASIFSVFFEKCLLSILEGFLKEEFLVFIWPFGFSLSFFLDLF
jgi:hypothetical protein